MLSWDHPIWVHVVCTVMVDLHNTHLRVVTAVLRWIRINPAIPTSGETTPFVTSRLLPQCLSTCFFGQTYSRV